MEYHGKIGTFAMEILYLVSSTCSGYYVGCITSIIVIIIQKKNLYLTR